MNKSKSKVIVERIEWHGRSYYKSISLPISPLKLWKALVRGLASEGIDVEALRSRRLRKGGR